MDALAQILLSSESEWLHVQGKQLLLILRSQIVNPIRHYLFKRDSYIGFDSVKIRSHLRLIRDSDTG